MEQSWREVIDACVPMLLILSVWISVLRKSMGGLWYGKYLKRNLVEQRPHNKTMARLVGVAHPNVRL